MSLRRLDKSKENGRLFNRELVKNLEIILNTSPLHNFIPKKKKKLMMNFKVTYKSFKLENNFKKIKTQILEQENSF